MDLDKILIKARQIANEVAAPEAAETDINRQWVEKTMRALQAQGLTALVVNTKYGGLGQGMLALAKVTEILGEACGSSGLCFGMHCVGTAVIAAKATADQAEAFLVPIAKGKHITTLALSEPGSGAHFYFPHTKLSQNENGYLVQGQKTFVTNGFHADSYVVSTVGAYENARPHEFSCVVIPKGSKGLTWKGKWEGVGMRGNSSLFMDLNDVRIPENHLLGEKGDQLWYIFHVVAPYFLIAMAGTYLGIAQRAFKEARDHLLKRTYSQRKRASPHTFVATSLRNIMG